MELNESNFESEVLQSEDVILVDFWGVGCPPCKMVSPIINSLSNQGYKVGKVNVNENPSLSESYGISAVPTLKFFKGGSEVKTLLGFHSEAELKRAFEEVK